MMSQLKLCHMKIKVDYNTPKLAIINAIESEHQATKSFFNSKHLKHLSGIGSLLREILKKIIITDRKTDEIISSLGAELCHDVNNPLAIISGLNEQLTIRLEDEQSMTEEFRLYLLKHIRTTERSVKRIANTTDYVREKTVASIKRLDTENSHNLRCLAK